MQCFGCNKTNRSTYNLTGKWQAIHKDIFLVYCTSLKSVNQLTLDYHINMVTKTEKQYCYGPHKYTVDADLTAVTEIGMSVLVPTNETSLCIWEFRSQPGYYVEIIFDSIDNSGFTGISHGCEYGGFFLMDGYDTSQTQNQFTALTGFGPFCRSFSPKNEVYKSLLGIRKFVSSTENLNILLFNVGGIGNFTIRAYVRATFCFGAVYGPNSFSPNPRYDIHAMWNFPTSQIKCLQIQLFIMPEPKAINISVIIHSSMFKNIHPQMRPLIHYSKLFNKKPVCSRLNLQYLTLRNKSSFSLLIVLGKESVCPSIEGVYVLSLKMPGEFCSIFPRHGSFLRPCKCGLLRVPSKIGSFSVKLSSKPPPFLTYIDVNDYDVKYFLLKIWRNGPHDFVNCRHLEIVIDELNQNFHSPFYWSHRIRKYSACDIGPRGIYIKTINSQQVEISIRCSNVYKNAKHIYLSYEVNSYKFPTMPQLCPNGFLLQNKQCYFLKSGYLHKPGWSWNDAKSYCISKNATLLSITSLKEMEATFGNCLVAFHLHLSCVSNSYWAI